MAKFCVGVSWLKMALEMAKLSLKLHRSKTHLLKQGIHDCHAQRGVVPIQIGSQGGHKGDVAEASLAGLEQHTHQVGLTACPGQAPQLLEHLR